MEFALPVVCGLFLFAVNSFWFAVIVSVFLDCFAGLYVWLFLFIWCDSVLLCYLFGG